MKYFYFIIWPLSIIICNLKWSPLDGSVVTFYSNSCTWRVPHGTQQYREIKFDFFFFWFSDSCLVAVEKAVAETDASSILPLGRQHSLLNIINVVIHKLGHLIHSYLPKVLQILLCVTATVSTLLDKRDQVSMTEVMVLVFCNFAVFFHSL